MSEKQIRYVLTGLAILIALVGSYFGVKLPVPEFPEEIPSMVDFVILQDDVAELQVNMDQVLMAVEPGMLDFSGYSSACYREQGGSKWVCESGGEIEIQSGATLDIQSGATTDFSGGMDLDGALLDLDADGDTSIQADTDDQIDIEISAADDFRFTANTFTALSGSSIVNNGALDQNDNIDQDGASDEVQLSITGYTTQTNDLVQFSGGLTDIGNGSYDTANGDNDLGVAGDLEVDGVIELDGALDADSDIDVDGTSNLDEVDIDGVTNLVVGTEHIGLVTIASATVITTANDGALFTVSDGEIWIVHEVYVNVTTNFDCTGNDCTMIIGDGNDTDGWCVLADAELQTTDTEGTGWQAGWQCQVAATIGVYGDENGGFVYAPSGADETIDVDVGGTDVAAGQATVYILYTRIQ